MHTISRKHLNFAQLETFGISRCPSTVITANGEVKTHEEATVYVWELDLFLTAKKSSNIRQQCYRSESFARITDVHMMGPMVKTPCLIQTGIRIQCNTENYVPIVVSGLSTTSSSSNSYGTTPPTSSQQESSKGSTPIPESVECESADEQARGHPSFNPTKNLKPLEMWTMSKYGATCHFPKYLIGCKNSERILWMEEPLSIETHTQDLLMKPLWSTKTSGTWQTPCLHSFPEKPKLRDLSEDQNYNGVLQKTYWWSGTQCRKFWWHDHSISQSPRWKMLISKQAPWCKTWLLNGFNHVRA